MISLTPCHSVLTLIISIDVVFDQMGYSPIQKGQNNPGFGGMLRLLEEDHCWVKLSGAYRISQSKRFPYPDVEAFARALATCNPGSIR